MSDWWEEYKVDVPEGRSGDWAIEQFTISEKEAKFANAQSMFCGVRTYYRPGTYTRLIGKAPDFVNPMMSDTPDEILDHLSVIQEARGQILVNGLGLGMVLQAMLRKTEVEHVTVIEESPDIIALVEPHYRKMFGDKFTIIQADAFTWEPPKGKRYDVVWHDIWENICMDNLQQMAKLHRKYGKRCNWQGSWKREYLLYQRRREAAQERAWFAPLGGRL